MKIPVTPPAIADLLHEVAEDRIPAVLGGRPLVEGKYLHWDNLRHREPPEGVSPREWWLSIRLARRSAQEAMPLLNKDGDAFTLVHASPIREGLHRIDQSFGVAGSPSGVQAQVEAQGRNYLLASSFMEEAIRSSQLEGASTTRARAKDMIREHREPEDPGERMILNNFLAMENIADLADQPLTAERVFELHRVLVEGTLDHPDKAGVFRKTEDEVVVELLHSIDSAHVPPDADELPERLQRLVAFANGETPSEWLHPVIRAIVLHFMIGYDHPFVDGNGRVARALFYWAMLRHGYPMAKFLSISRILRDAPAKYARAYLYTETDGGDLTYFVDHQIDVVLRSITALEVYVEEKLTTTRAMEAKVLAFPDLNHRQIRLLGHALRHPGFQYTVRSHQTSHRVVYATARSDLIDLAEKGLLLKAKRGRTHVFVAPLDLAERVDRNPHRPAPMATIDP